MEHQENTDQFLEFFIEGAKNLGFSIQEGILEKFHLYYKELCFWNLSVNLTGLKTDKEKAVLLFADSLAGFLALPASQAVSILDIGTGAGFPGIPLKLAFPNLNVTLMEPHGNKTAFLHTVIGKLELENVSVIQKRLEDYNVFVKEEHKWDVAISKGVSLEHILPYVKNILKKDGKLVVFCASNIDNHLELQGMAIDREIPYELPYGLGKRLLFVLKILPD